MMRYRFLLFFILILSGCSNSVNISNKNTFISHADAYFNTYAQRQNFTQFIEFYAEDAVLEDMVFGHKAQGKDQITAFFNWSAGNFAVLDDQLVLVVEDKIVDSTTRTVVARGVFNRFNYASRELGPWRFLIVLKFDEKGKIIYQQDWINYTPKSDFTGGENLNQQY